MDEIAATLICTTYNEEDTIEEFLESVSLQTRNPTEIVIVDGGSSDETLQIAHQYAEESLSRFKLIEGQDLNISEGRNRAVEEAESDIIVAADAGTQLDPEWFEHMVTPFINGNVDVVSGYYLPKTTSLFQKCAARFAYLPVRSIDSESFLPSSRSIAFTKEAWEDVGGYPETLRKAEDTMFASNLRKNGYKFQFQPNSVVYWDHSPNLKSFIEKRFSYSYWAGIAGIPGTRWKSAVRFCGGITLLLTSGGLWWAAAYDWVVLPLATLVACIILIVTLDWRHINELDSSGTGDIISEFVLLTVLRVLNDILVVTGYIAGSVKRITNGENI